MDQNHGCNPTQVAPKQRKRGCPSMCVERAGSSRMKTTRVFGAPSMSSSSNDAVAISHPINILLLVERRALSDNAYHRSNIAGAYTPERSLLYH